MEKHLLKIAGSLEELDLRCPKCNSNQVLVCRDSQGYYEIKECHKCGYKSNKC